MNLRWIVLKILDGIEFESIFVHEAIERFTADLDLNKQDRGFIKRVVFGTIENQIYIDYVINQYSKVKVKKMKPAIRHTMRLSVYQLLFMENIPESAVCNEAVKLIKKRKMYRLTGFVNGVLRQIIRSKESIKLPDKAKEPIRYLSIKYSFEEILLKYLLKEYTFEQLESILRISNEEAPITIRVQKSRTTKEALIKALSEEGIETEEGQLVDGALHLLSIDHIMAIESFKKGLFQVQDESSMLVAEVGFEEGMETIIDVCSAPGGKTTHLADKLKGNGRVIAFDLSDHKLELIKENVERLSLNNVDVRQGDATVLNEELIGKADLVIADVPCSGLGIIRKKPDIKWRITPDIIKGLIPLQRKILDTVKHYVKPNGVLLYSTCTITKAENEENVQWFLEHNSEFERVDIESYETKESGYLQLYPVSNGPDGFFIAKLRRKSNNG